MPSDIQFQNDAAEPITSLNFGAVDAGGNVVRKILIENAGTTGVTSATVSITILGGSDGANYVTMAEDDGTGNPGTYSADDIFLGNIDAAEVVPLWLKVTIPGGATPAGNPRIAELRLEYTAT